MLRSESIEQALFLANRIVLCEWSFRNLEVLAKKKNKNKNISNERTTSIEYLVIKKNEPHEIF